MYVIRAMNGRYVPPNFETSSCLQTELKGAQRFTSIPLVVEYLQKFAIKMGYDAPVRPTICRLIVTPGSTARREVPLGTPGSKYAIKGQYTRTYVGPATHEMRRLGDIMSARLYDTTQEVLNGYVSAGGMSKSAFDIVAVLEETTGETLSVEEVK